MMLATKTFVLPEIFSFLTDLEAAVAEHATGDPLQIVAEYLTEEDYSDATEPEILAALGVTWEATQVIKASVDNDTDNPYFNEDIRLRIQNIL